MNLKEISLFITEPILLIPEKIDAQEPGRSSDSSVTDSKKSTGDSYAHQEIEEDIPELETATYEGNFQKGLLILYQGNELPDDSRLFLMNILKAVNHSLKDIALISEVSVRNGHPDSITQLNPRNILIFGKLNHAIMQIKRDDYAIIQEDYTYLFADDLKELEVNKPLKKKLWTALQLLFNINS